MSTPPNDNNPLTPKTVDTEDHNEPPSSPTRKRVVKRIGAEEAALLEKQAEQRRMNGRRGMAFYGDVPTAGAPIDPMGSIPVPPCSSSCLLSQSGKVSFDNAVVIMSPETTSTTSTTATTTISLGVGDDTAGTGNGANGNGTANGANYGTLCIPVDLDTDEFDGASKRIVTPSTLQKARENRVLKPSRKLTVAYAETMGRRPSMEDELFVYGALGGNESVDAVGLFDGHNGDQVSKFVASVLPEVLKEEVIVKKKTVTPELVKEVFLETSKQLKEKKIIGGATALVSIFLHDSNKVFIANVGDCRAVVGGSGIGKRITVDHRPGSQQEKQRIEALGGTVNSLVSKDGRVISRVNGLLAVSRSFGDLELEAFITPDPDVFTLNVDDLKEGFLIVACDGLWDVMGDNDATDIVKKHFALFGNDLEGACVRLRDFAYANGSTDNITVLIISLDAALPFCNNLRPIATSSEERKKGSVASKKLLPTADSVGGDMRRRTDGGFTQLSVPTVAPLASLKVAGTGKKSHRGKSTSPKDRTTNTTDKPTETTTTTITAPTTDSSPTATTTTAASKEGHKKRRNNRHTWDGREYERQQRVKQSREHHRHREHHHKQKHRKKPEDGTKADTTKTSITTTETKEHRRKKRTSRAIKTEITTSTSTTTTKAKSTETSEISTTTTSTTTATTANATDKSEARIEMPAITTTSTTSTTSTTVSREEEKKHGFSLRKFSSRAKRMSIWKKEEKEPEKKDSEKDKEVEKKEAEKEEKEDKRKENKAKKDENKTKFTNVKDKMGRRATIQ